MSESSMIADNLPIHSTYCDNCRHVDMAYKRL